VHGLYSAWTCQKDVFAPNPNTIVPQSSSWTPTHYLPADHLAHHHCLSSPFLDPFCFQKDVIVPVSTTVSTIRKNSIIHINTQILDHRPCSCFFHVMIAPFQMDVFAPIATTTVYHESNTLATYTIACSPPCCDFCFSIQCGAISFPSSNARRTSLFQLWHLPQFSFTGQITNDSFCPMQISEPILVLSEGCTVPNHGRPSSPCQNRYQHRAATQILALQILRPPSKTARRTFSFQSLQLSSSSPRELITNNSLNLCRSLSPTTCDHYTQYARCEGRARSNCGHHHSQYSRTPTSFA
jgi:hypothetical protein